MQSPDHSHKGHQWALKGREVFLKTVATAWFLKRSGLLRREPTMKPLARRLCTDATLRVLAVHPLGRATASAPLLGAGGGGIPDEVGGPSNTCPAGPVKARDRHQGPGLSQVSASPGTGALLKQPCSPRYPLSPWPQLVLLQRGSCCPAGSRTLSLLLTV